MNRMVGRDLFYVQGLPSYGDSMGVKLKMLVKKIFFKGGLWQTGFSNFTIFSRNYVMVSKMVVSFQIALLFFCYEIIINSTHLACVKTTLVAHTT